MRSISSSSGCRRSTSSRTTRIRRRSFSSSPASSSKSCCMGRCVWRLASSLAALPATPWSRLPTTGTMERAGVTSGAYFPSKSRALLALRSSGSADLMAAKISAITPDASGEAQILAGRTFHDESSVLSSAHARLITEVLPLPQGPTMARTLLSSTWRTSSMTAATRLANRSRPSTSWSADVIGRSGLGQCGSGGPSRTDSSASLRHSLRWFQSVEADQARA